MTYALPVRPGPARYRAHCNRLHAMNRARERFGLALRFLEVLAIEDAIAAGSPDVVPLGGGHGGPGRTVYAYRHDRGWLPLVYCRSTRSIVTVLPDAALDPYRDALEDTR